MSICFGRSCVSHDLRALFSESTTSGFPHLNPHVSVPARLPVANSFDIRDGIDMRAARLAFYLLLLWCLIPSPSLIGQAVTKSPVRIPNRDAAAVAIANNCVAALGGSALLRAVGSWTADGTYISASSTGPVHWEATPSEFRLEYGTGSSASIITSGSGQVVNKLPSRALKIPYHMWRAWIVPIRLGTLLETDIQSKSVSIEPLQDDNQQATVLRIIDHASYIDETVTEQLWYIDKTTFLPLKILYHPSRLSRPDASIWEAWNLSNYRNIDGVLVPFTLSRSLGSSTLESITLKSVKLNASLPSTDFVSPEVSK